MKYKKYPSYKDSGVEWLGEVPEHWELSKVSYNFTAKKGIKASLYTKEYCGEIIGEYPVYSGQTENNGVLARINEFEFDSGMEGYLFSTTVGAKAMTLSHLRGKFSLSQNCMIIKPLKDTNIINTRFYFYHKQPLFKFERGLIPEHMQASFRMEDLYQYKICLPQIQEQQQIANFLDKATAKIDTLIEKQTKQIELLKEKRQAVISHAVTKGLDINNSHWKNYRLDWINTIIRGNTGFKKDELLENGEYVALQYGKTYKVDEVNETFNFYVNNEFYKFNQIVNYGDTILISTSETIEDLGHSCFYNRKDLGLIGGEQILLKPNIKFVHEKYLYYSSKIFSTKLKKYATGLKVFRFSIDDLKELFISIPGLEEQQQIANYLDEKTSKIDTLIEKSNKSIELLKEKRIALISAAVTGKIDVREEV